MNNNIQKFDAAYRRVIDKLISNGFKVRNTALINNERYSIVYGEPNNILITFKKELFHNFGQMFINKYSNEEGDTINVFDLKISIRANVEEIYLILPEGTVYKIGMQNFLEKSYRWVNREGKEVRSVSINNYEEVFKV